MFIDSRIDCNSTIDKTDRTEEVRSRRAVASRD
jgi:hypothetical protein